MKVLLVSHADGGGGAAIAANRLLRAMQKEHIDSQMFVLRKTTDNPQVKQVVNGGWQKVMSGIRRKLARAIIKQQQTENMVLHSPAIFRSGLADCINASNVDVVNLHWICEEMISIEEIAKIKKPLVWTLHDTWPFCGAEHYYDSINDRVLRFKQGYLDDNRPVGHKGWDIDRLIWQRKLKAWKHKKIHLVAPSQWMANQAKDSILFHDQRVSVVPNGLCLNVFKPYDKNFARGVWNLPQDKKLILFGAVNGASDPRKGFDYLRQSLNKLAEQDVSSDVDAVIFGGGELNIHIHNDIRMNVHNVGVVKDEANLALLYAASDLFVTPSTQDNYPNTLLEAMACGLPCIGFRIGGIPEIINHGVNGFLASPFSTDELVKYMALLLISAQSNIISNDMRKSARKSAEDRNAEHLFAQRMMAIFDSML